MMVVQSTHLHRARLRGPRPGRTQTSPEQKPWQCRRWRRRLLHWSPSSSPPESFTQSAALRRSIDRCASALRSAQTQWGRSSLPLSLLSARRHLEGQSEAETSAVERPASKHADMTTGTAPPPRQRSRRKQPPPPRNVPMDAWGGLDPKWWIDWTSTERVVGVGSLFGVMYVAWGDGVRVRNEGRHGLLACAEDVEMAR